jgi:hypothetical protein
LQRVQDIIVLMDDECIFKQFILTGKSWKGPNGETAVVPKDDKAGVMIRAFQSHEFGIVNKYREGKFYSDADAAMAMRQSKKKALTSTLFIQEFEYSKANEGYWTYSWMVCQLDDCVDVPISDVLTRTGE